MLTSLEVISKGIWSKVFHFIDGMSFNLENSNLNIRNCMNDADQNDAIKAKLIKVNLNNNKTHFLKPNF